MTQLWLSPVRKQGKWIKICGVPECVLKDLEYQQKHHSLSGLQKKKNSRTLHQHLKSLDLKYWTNLTWLSHVTTGGLPCPIWQTLQTCPWAQDFNPSHQRRQTLYLIQPEHEEVPHPYKFIQHLLAFFSSFSPFPSDILAYLRKQPDAHPGFRYSFNFLLETHLCLVIRLT